MKGFFGTVINHTLQFFVNQRKQHKLLVIRPFDIISWQRKTIKKWLNEQACRARSLLFEKWGHLEQQWTTFSIRSDCQRKLAKLFIHLPSSTFIRLMSCSIELSPYLFVAVTTNSYSFPFSISTA